jgi:hypothetical protein
MYKVDSNEDNLDNFVGSHKFLPVKLLSKTPEPINFFDWVNKNEFEVINSDNREFLANHLCCLEILRLVSIPENIKLGFVTFLYNFWISFRFDLVLITFELLIDGKFL